MFFWQVSLKTLYYDKLAEDQLIKTTRQMVDDSATAIESKLSLAVQNSQQLAAKGEQKK